MLDTFRVQQVRDNELGAQIAGKYRHEKGGHVLFRPAGLLAFAGAVARLIRQGSSLPSAVKILAPLEYELASDQWNGVLWNPVSRTMIARNKKLATDMLLYWVGENGQHSDLLARYQRAVENPNAELPLPH